MAFLDLGILAWPTIVSLLGLALVLLGVAVPLVLPRLDDDVRLLLLSALRAGRVAAPSVRASLWLPWAWHSTSDGLTADPRPGVRWGDPSRAPPRVAVPSPVQILRNVSARADAARLR